MSALGVIAAPSIVGASESDFMKLGRLFEAAREHERAAWEAVSADLPEAEQEAANEIANAASERAHEIADQIAELPARTLDEIRMKGRVLHWSWHAFENHEDEDGADMRMLRSLVSDLTAV